MSTANAVGEAIATPGLYPLFPAYLDIVDELLPIMLSYLALRDIRAFGSTNQKYAHLVFESEKVDEVFLGKYELRFGIPHASMWGETLPGKHKWKTLYKLNCKMLETHQERDNVDDSLQTLHLLTPEQEAESTFCDNLRLDGRYECPTFRGYSCFFDLSSTGPLMVFGSFPGAAVFRNVDHLLDFRSRSPPMSESLMLETSSDPESVSSYSINCTNTPDIVNQPTRILNRPNCNINTFTLNSQDTADSTKVTFFGCESGDLIALGYNTKSSQALSSDTFRELGRLSTGSSVEGMDTCTELHGTGGLVTAHRDGTLRFFPDALRAHSFLRSYVLVENLGTDIRGFQICQLGENSFTAIIRRTRSLCILNYEKNPVTLATTTTLKEHPELGCNLDADQIFVARFFSKMAKCLWSPVQGDDEVMIVLGTGRGGKIIILGWSPLNPSKLRKLGVYKIHEQNQNDCIYCISRTGDVLILSMGNAGLVVFFDISQRKIVKEVKVHPGRRHFPEGVSSERLSPGIIHSEVFHERQSVISMARDGHVDEWKL